jgi:hypothetical protein
MRRAAAMRECSCSRRRNTKIGAGIGRAGILFGTGMRDQQRRITRWLESAPPAALTLYAMAAAFSTYFCMYAFRKPFAAAKFNGLHFLGTGVELKTAFVISQIVGYALSKYIGIKVCSEVSRARRAMALAGLVLAAQGALLLFAILPRDLKVVAIFLNGLPLGMVWGMVVSYLEGRRTSELLLAALSCSFIVSSGVVKSVGAKLMQSGGVGEFWMPFGTGLIFLPAFLLSTWLLDQIPQPTAEDTATRVHREPMNAAHRLAFVRHFAWGLLPLMAVYFFLTAYRDFRDNFAAELFTQLGYAGQADVFTRSEVPVALGVMVCLAALNLVRDNRRGLIAAYGVMTGGLLVMGLATLLLQAHFIGGMGWMILIGFGSYLAYVPFGSVLFDRLMASTRVAGTAVFAIYLADAIGYTGSVGVQLYRDLFASHETRLAFFCTFTYLLSGLGSVLLILSAAYFVSRRAQRAAVANENLTPAVIGAQVE